MSAGGFQECSCTDPVFLSRRSVHIETRSREDATRACAYPASPRRRWRLLTPVVVVGIIVG